MEGRHRYSCAVLTAVLMCISLQTALVISQDCTYLYTEQPPETITCNPYLPANRTDEILRLQCALTAPSGSQLVINWYHNRTGESQITNDAIEALMPNDTTFRSVLTLNNPSTETDSGDYYCQAEVDGLLLQPSERFTLSDSEFEYINLPDCLDSMSTFSRDSTLCADVSSTESTPAPTTLTPQPTPSQSTTSTTSTPSQTTVINTNEPTSTDGITSDSETATADDEGLMPPMLQVWIYVLVGVAAVFFMIIVILSIMCVGLCLRRNKTHDSQTLKRNGGTGGTIGSSMVSNEMYHSTDTNLAPPPPQYQPYSTLHGPTYEPIGLLGSRPDYSRLHRPSPPPLPSTLPKGRSATMNGSPPIQFRSMSELTSEKTAGSEEAPTLPPKGDIPSHHVYRELENPTLSYSPSTASPMSAHIFERGDSTAQLLPSTSPFSKANGGPYRKFSSDSATQSVNESLYSPTTPVSAFMASNGLEDIPETGMSFAEPNDPTAFPVHEYESIPGRKTKKYESPVPDEGRAIGANPQMRSSVKSANYETDPNLTENEPTVSRKINPYDSTSHVTEPAVSRSSINPYDTTSHIKTPSPTELTDFRENSDLKIPPPPPDSPPPENFTDGFETDYSRLNFKNGNYSKLGSRPGDPDFFKGASEVCLTSNGLKSHFGNGSSSVYDSDHSSQEDSLPHSRRGQSVPLSPPPVYPTYNQLTLPGFQASRYPPYVGSKTTV